MGKTFIALENPESWLGNKDLNLPAKEPEKSTIVGGKNAKKQRAAEAKREMEALEKQMKEKYGPRLKFLEDHKVEMENRATKEDRVVVLDATKNRGDMYVASSGSLPSMLKRLEKFCDNGRRFKFDTLIFIGHGDEGDMSVGIGHLPSQPRTKKGIKFYEEIRADTRMMTVKNPDVWCNAFERVASCLTEDANSRRLHIFLVGCATGLAANTDTAVTSLSKLMASRLASTLRMNMAVYGTTETITAKDTEIILENLDDIKAKCIPKSPYPLRGGAFLKCKYA